MSGSLEIEVSSVARRRARNAGRRSAGELAPGMSNRPAWAEAIRVGWSKGDGFGVEDFQVRSPNGDGAGSKMGAEAD